MKKLILFSFMLFAITKASIGQSTIHFENLPLFNPETYYNGTSSPLPGVIGFSSGNVTLINKHDTAWGGSWSGWGYSNMTDTNTTGLGNQMSCITGKGQNNSIIYGVAYVGYSMYDYIKLIQPAVISSVYLSNSTYAYLSMKNGDQFAKVFGGATGNDPDFFKLDFYGWRNGIKKTDSVSFYLADYRDVNNANDYIVKDWRMVDMTILGEVDSITYQMSSSDTTAFGYINTPTYFCMDNMQFQPLSVSDLSQNTSIKIYPNPINNEFQIANTSTEAMKLSIFNLNGQTIYTNELIGNNSMKINSEKWSKGVYVIKIQQGQHQFYQKIIK
jgi:hypothetical protein